MTNNVKELENDLIELENSFFKTFDEFCKRTDYLEYSYVTKEILKDLKIKNIMINDLKEKIAKLK